LFFDKACRFEDDHPEVHDLPLYIDVPTDGGKEPQKMCDVDAFITVNDRIAVVVEIEESGIRANKLCSKYLTAVLSQYYKRKERVIPVGSSLLFIQIVQEHYDLATSWRYLAGMFSKVTVPDQDSERRKLRYALYWGSGSLLEGSENGPLEALIMEHLESIGRSWSDEIR